VTAWQLGDRPTRRPDVESVDVAGELVLWDPYGQRVHRLDPVASLLWPFLDGSVTIDELAADAAEVWETNREDAQRGISHLVAQLDDAGLLASEDAPYAAHRGGTGAGQLIANPVRCGTDLSPWPWQPATTVEVGGRTISFRTSSAELSGALRQALRLHVVDTDAPLNYSLALGAGPGDLHLLFWGHCTVARCRTTAEAVGALFAHLRGHGPTPDGAVRFDGHLLVAGSSGVIFPATERTALWGVAARLRKEGAAPAHRPWVDVDASLVTAVTTDTRLEVDPEPLAGALDGPLRAWLPPAESIRVAGLYVPDWVDASSSAALATALVQQRLLEDPGTAIPRFAELGPRLAVLQHGLEDRPALLEDVRTALELGSP
jgi:hypothetical protein